MISAQEALLIANQMAQEENWGRVDRAFQVVLDTHAGGTAIWNVDRKVPRLGSD